MICNACEKAIKVGDAFYKIQKFEMEKLNLSKALAESYCFHYDCIYPSTLMELGLF